MKKCPPHHWTTIPLKENIGDTTQHCVYCQITFRDWARGFGSNVQPSKRSSRGTIGAA